ncbi:glycosyltransferase family 2 protein [Anatilimnocola sp. NA78]|uniref:glycosyltransferase family 2 protein n=1 Tax=Anatilimnocola sp. NA78 TaxID=3415683 RepID=UPI003CE49ACF
MKFSFVVPTIGRPTDLQRFIEHLLLQESSRLDLREVELLVVDQSGKPETGELLARLQTPFAVRHLPMAGRGASRARNYGWSFARGEFLTFPDDDCHYPLGMLERVLARFENPQVDALMVQVEHLGRQDQTGGPITRDNVLFRCVESGFFIRRARAADLRYDELMGIGAATPWNSDEGPDLLLRLLQHGLRIDFDPTIVIHHPNPLQTLDERLQQRSYSYSRGRGYLLRKHQFPLNEVARTLIRSCGGSLLMGLTGRPYWARYYWNAFAGKWLGYVGGKDAPAQVLTSPLEQPRLLSARVAELSALSQ